MIPGRLALVLAACGAAACGPDPAAPAAKAPSGPSDLRSFDRNILLMVRQPVKTRVSDVFPHAPYAVSMEPDPLGTYGRVKIDLDRDHRPDEVWVVDAPDRVKRMISTADNEIYDLTLWLKDGVWTTIASQE